MVSAHLNRQIFASIGICPYCLVDEECFLNGKKELYFPSINPFKPKSVVEKWANTPQYHDPSFELGKKIQRRSYLTIFVVAIPKEGLAEPPNQSWYDNDEDFERSIFCSTHLRVIATRRSLLLGWAIGEYAPGLVITTDRGLCGSKSLLDNRKNTERNGGSGILSYYYM